MPTDIGEARKTASRESRRRRPLLHPIPLPTSTAVFCVDCFSSMDKKDSILIVDDDVGTCRTLTLIFGKKGYETETAGTEREAIDKAQGSFFNLVLLDIWLPDTDGMALIPIMKEIHPDIAATMITGRASLDTAVQAMNEGASAYITKPFDMNRVLATVRQALEKQHLAIQNKSLLEEVQQELVQRKKAEEALREGNLRLEDILAQLRQT